MLIFMFGTVSPSNLKHLEARTVPTSECEAVNTTFEPQPCQLLTLWEGKGAKRATESNTEAANPHIAALVYRTMSP